LHNHQWPVLLHTLAGWGKQSKLLQHDVILLQDNAMPHRHHYVQNLVQQWGWEVLAHPPYFPDLATCDYWLFAHVKEHLWGE
jgi:transposase